LESVKGPLINFYPEPVPQLDYLTPQKKEIKNGFSGRIFALLAKPCDLQEGNFEKYAL